MRINDRYARTQKFEDFYWDLCVHVKCRNVIDYKNVLLSSLHIELVFPVLK